MRILLESILFIVILLLLLLPSDIYASSDLKIAFSRIVPQKPGSISKIFIMDIDGTNVRQITSGPYDGGPTWSPDGKKIAFTRSWDIYCINVDGTGEQQLTFTPERLEFHPSWSPLGDKIAFEYRGNQGRDYGIGIISLKDGSYKILLEDRGMQPAFSPDGKRIAFIDYLDRKVTLCVMDADGGNIQRLTNHNRQDMCPCWSPDSRYIVFSADTAMNGDFDIYRLDMETKRIELVIASPGREWFPNVSYRGDIAFEEMEFEGLYKICVKTKDGNLIKIETGFSETGPAFSPPSPQVVDPLKSAINSWGVIKRGW